ncbi:hypothetical protein [Actinoplanes sp. NBRC 103695]|uniref:hypothetical protein n=1 Tax=Actinoplanes sp. NBRC 103695 TaxID=3032202 RepID=UPI0024A5BACC|nr:hypothetical protein [Actinoplanes sp. NBRC 103695]GLZ01597.1 hypothetical protein Acsp02_88480 [Actinoplanes sp. NBRC 103695]
MDLDGPAAPPELSMLPGVGVVVETLLIGATDDGLTFRAFERPLGDDEHPDQVARELAGFGAQLLHSTSWRFAAGRIVLTYAALPDPDPRTATQLEGVGLTAVGSGPLQPSPATIDLAAVVLHAVRHLAFLRHTDDAAAAAANGDPRLWALISRHEPALAGTLRR